MVLVRLTGAVKAGLQFGAEYTNDNKACALNKQRFTDSFGVTEKLFFEAVSDKNDSLSLLNIPLVYKAPARLRIDMT